MKTVATIGLDIAKQVYQVHGADKSGRALLQRTLRRGEVVRFSTKRFRVPDRGWVTPWPLGEGWGLKLRDGRVQAWQPQGVGLQVPSGVDAEVSVSGAARRCGSTMPGVAAGDSLEPGDGDPRGVDQPGSCAYADRDTAVYLRVAGSAVPEREEFAQVAE